MSVISWHFDFAGCLTILKFIVPIPAFDKSVSIFCLTIVCSYIRIYLYMML